MNGSLGICIVRVIYGLLVRITARGADCQEVLGCPAFLAADGAHLAGWIASHVDPAMERVDDNLAMLRERLPAPCWGVLPHAEHPDPALLASRLRIPMLA